MKIVPGFAFAVLMCSLTLPSAGGAVNPKKEDVPKYLKMLQTAASATDRAKAADMLGKRGGINANDVEEAIEPLKKALEKDKEKIVRVAAARALGNIQPMDVAGTVTLMHDRLKNDAATDVKMAIVIALGQFGPDAKEALPTLREMLSKFDTKAAKKSTEAQTLQSAINLITAKKKKGG